MVLESFLAGIVNKFCSRFVKDFKKENLTISLSGEVCLNDFEVKTDEIKDLQLPVELKSFLVGKLHVNIPLTHLSTQSIKIELNDVYVLLGTPNDPKWDVDALYISEQSKIFLMQQFLELFQPSTPSDADINSVHHAHHPPKAANSLLSPSIMAILRNAAVTIERIHIRFEDGLSGMALEEPTQFALGLTLSSVSVLPSTQNLGTQDHTKIAKLKELAVYFKQDQMIEKLSRDQQRVAFRAPFDAASAKSNSFPYLLEPLNCEISIQMTLPPAAEMPSHLGLKLTLPEVRVNLAHSHYMYLGCFLDGVDRFDRFTLYRRFRPVDEKGGKKNWQAYWHFAIASVLIDLNDPLRRRPTWRSTLNLVLIGLQYTALRRKVEPYLIRQQTQGDHHFLQYREDFKLNKVHTQAPYDRSLSLTMERLPSSVTAFNEGIYAGVYGLAKKFQAAPVSSVAATSTETLRPPEPVEAALSAEEIEVKSLWRRQLCIDAMFRPIVAAKLRSLASKQLVVKSHVNAVATNAYNNRKGVLTVTLVELQAYVGKFRLPLHTITQEPNSNEMYMMESADKKSTGMKLRVLTVFSHGLQGTYKTSNAMMQELYPDLFASKSHEYTNLANTALPQTISATATIGAIKIVFVLPKAAKKGTADHIMFQLEKLRFQLIAYPMQAQLKQSFLISRLDVFLYTSIETTQKQFIQGPKAIKAPIATPEATKTEQVKTEQSAPATSPEPVKRSNSIFGSFKKLFDDDDKPTEPTPQLTTPSSVVDDRDRSGDYTMNIDVGALHVAIPSVVEDEKQSIERVIELVIPGTKLHVNGGRGQPTNVATNEQTIVKMTRDLTWVLGQLEKIGMVLSHQVKNETQPFYLKDIASKAKVRRFEYEIHELERQLAKYRRAVREVVQTPEKYSIDIVDCNSLKMLVRDMQPKTILAKPNVLPYRALLQQGITLLKHNVRKGDPQWKTIWVDDTKFYSAKLTERKKAKAFPLSSITKVSIGEMTQALSRRGDEENIAKYFAVSVKELDHALSFECQTTEACQLVVTALQSCLSA
ncbi:hypothetical protein THRCLA_00898 [Thraustotheca clavata]|uniref:Chorein N-terminal domain-containing protein n=1 Tax=Thraustotheca clavata TaxID=74557 RepID=A0A1W0A9X5_9STRA|nr:hypothetical protein THRCLA_00898 [Thraustotheca clavata]